jgi:pimeloyl-ACP methyl ester carboxylesterase
LDARFRIITPDLRASGRSFYGGPLSWDQLADDVAGLIDELGLERAVIGGISFGAGCAVRVALRHPSLTAALVLLHPAFAGSEVGLTTAQQAAMHAMDAAGSRAVREGIQVLYPLFDALPAPMRDRALATVATYDPASVAAMTRFMASGAQPFASASELASITAPTLLVPGIDPTHPVEVADLYRHHLTGAAVHAVETADFASAIADFVDRLG